MFPIYVDNRFIFHSLHLLAPNDTQIQMPSSFLNDKDEETKTVEKEFSVSQISKTFLIPILSKVFTKNRIE